DHDRGRAGNGLPFGLRNEARHRAFLPGIREETRQVADVALDVALLAQIRKQLVERVRQVGQLVTAGDADLPAVVAGSRVFRCTRSSALPAPTAVRMPPASAASADASASRPAASSDVPMISVLSPTGSR